MFAGKRRALNQKCHTKKIDSNFDYSMLLVSHRWMELLSITLFFFSNIKLKI
ncbi:hypothetical protein TH5N_20490 [Tetragenococcus halophilus]|nr:hypothetical protein TH3N_20520 [Tetragenococcus halophilus]GEQ41171.1 hypothetical protein TH5N_20490 [Tetragenococcus halophilus]GEQ43430.1 hypothetical protein TH6N_20560 [Tetragenococcus halophilus]GEQ45688.1 hypothetical protein TH8N_20580 [Tetragenococcus halophilus]GEQ47947.1 hypothetical protein TH9N_20600 [Tetragenococcus halophilus]